MSSKFSVLKNLKLKRKSAIAKCNQVPKQTQKDNLKTIVVKYFRPGVVTGGIITGVNLYNYDKSPIYFHTHSVTNSLVLDKIVLGSVVKGCVYGAFYPFAVLGIVFGLYDNNPVEFSKHFIPFSVYGRESSKKFQH